MFSAFHAENAAGTAAFLIKEFNREIVSEQLVGPAHVVLDLAGLHAVDRVVELLGHGADLLVRHLVVGALVVQAADRGDDGGGAGGKDLLQGAVLGGGDDLVDGELALGDLDAPFLQELNDGVAGDAGQDRAGIQGGR